MVMIKGFVGGYDHLRMALNYVLVGMIGGCVGGYGLGCQWWV